MKTSETLTNALAWFGPNGEKWLRGISQVVDHPDKGCSIVALHAITSDLSRVSGLVGEIQPIAYEYKKARDLLRSIVGNITNWNDNAQDFSVIQEGFKQAIAKAIAEGD